MKRIFDIICSACGLFILSPFLIVFACKIKGNDGGPVFYRGVRVGLDGKLFRIHKFRTMVVNAEKIGGASTAEDDPRITTIGRFLRKYKLDELPQLIDVFKGDMSFVGPRPEVKRYTDLYTEEEKSILSVRPGITDWASIWNSNEAAILAGAEDPDKAYEDLIRPTKVKLQIRYVLERSFRKDIELILLTLKTILRSESQAVREIRGLC